MRQTTLMLFLASLLCSNTLFGGNNSSETYILFKDKKVSLISTNDSYGDERICVKYNNGSYNPCFSRLSGVCGSGYIDYKLKKHHNDSVNAEKGFCESPFTEVESIGEEATRRVISGVISFGFLSALQGTLHTKVVNPSLVNKYLEDTDIKDFEPLLKLCQGKNTSVIHDFNFDDLLAESGLLKQISKLPADDNVIIFNKTSKKWLYVDRGSTPNQLVVNWLKDLMEPRQPDPVYVPAMITDPYAPPIVELAKDEFETKAQYKVRLDQAIKDREKTILDNQKQHAKLIEERNKEVNRLRGVYKKEIVGINKEQDEKQKKLAPKIEQYAKLAFLMTRKQISLTNPQYDAETGIMEVNISVKPSYENKLITFKQNADEARYFKNNLSAVETEGEYEVKKNTFRLKKIISKYDGKTYVHETSIIDFLPEEVSLENDKLNSFKIVFTPDEETNMFAIQSNKFEQTKVASASSFKNKSSNRKK